MALPQPHQQRPSGMLRLSHLPGSNDVLPKFYPSGEMESYIHRTTCAQMSIGALFVIAQTAISLHVLPLVNGQATCSMSIPLNTT